MDKQTSFILRDTKISTYPATNFNPSAVSTVSPSTYFDPNLVWITCPLTNPISLPSLTNCPAMNLFEAIIPGQCLNAPEGVFIQAAGMNSPLTEAIRWPGTKVPSGRKCPGKNRCKSIFWLFLLFLGGKTLKMAPTMTLESFGAWFGFSQNLGPSPLSNMQPCNRKFDLIEMIL